MNSIKLFSCREKSCRRRIWVERRIRMCAWLFFLTRSIVLKRKSNVAHSIRAGTKHSILRVSQSKSSNLGYCTFTCLITIVSRAMIRSARCFCHCVRWTLPGNHHFGRLWSHQRRISAASCCVRCAIIPRTPSWHLASWRRGIWRRRISTGNQVSRMTAHCLNSVCNHLSSFADPYVKVWLQFGDKRIEKRKTPIFKCTLNPHFNDSFSFNVPWEKIRECSLDVMVMDFDNIGRNELIGRILLAGEFDFSACNCIISR